MIAHTGLPSDIYGTKIPFPSCTLISGGGGGGGGVLPVMAYTGRLHPKGVPFSDFTYLKGKGFHKLRYIKG